MDELEMLKEILPLIQGGGSAAIIVVAFIAIKEWRRMNAKINRIEVRLARLFTALRLMSPELKAALDERDLGDEDSDSESGID